MRIENGTEIGISDIKGRPIRNGDRINVKHINYMGTSHETVAEEFIAKVEYHAFQAMFKYYPEGPDNDDHEGYIFNHRSSTFEVL